MKKSLLSRHTEVRRSGRIKPKKRKPSEFARIYGGDERRRFVESLPCVVCGRTPSENAHTENEGMGRKGHYTTIIPLCRKDHRLTHGVNGSWSWLGLTPDDRKHHAAATEAAWQRHAAQPEDTRDE